MRVFVTGPTRSGKTTLASKLARRESLPLFHLDDTHWVRHPAGDVRRAPSERLALLEQVVQQDAWIIEGVQFKWSDIAIERADCIVILDIPRWQNTMRILRRFSSRCRTPGIGNRGTLKALSDETRWSGDYYGYERKMLLDKVGRWSDKLTIIRSRQDERNLVSVIPAPSCS
ncbi:hypothetical protein BLA50215_00002 [Burkholderia lata]|uniref:DNA topology modulation protein FlaR n=1 Tax=Burkholderia lata (strain ATCC 17760 / DSM 23089 / LMG 22485 / NCIMB 9086 / R18194 / 383) TaxID=482957 RepID=UPI0014539467|nr:DNA topology modulation protein FlaR [Burkholderia lata]VWC63919.1 hypothetical protein BLA50215_00002 [Burkholderia lata]